MENKLTNEEIAKVFVMYLGCDVLVKGGSFEYLKGERPERLLGVINDYTHQFFTAATEGLRNNFYFKDGEYKLLLAPLSKISDEHAVEVAKIEYAHLKNCTNERITFLANGFEFHSGNFQTYYFSYNRHGSFSSQYLILKSYAVPLFFAPIHWANGKTAIELNLAIEKP